MRQFMWMIVGAAVMLSGCLPIELDTSPDGQVLIPRQEGLFSYDPGSGQVRRVWDGGGQSLVFARYVPNDGVVAVTKGQGGGMGMGESFSIQRVENGKAKRLAGLTNITYIAVSPDGKQLALTRVADDQVGGIDENLPELKVIDLTNGATRQLLSNTSTLMRWTPDSKSLVTVQMTSKTEQVYVGSLVKVDVASAKATPLAAVAGPQGMHLALSPDGAMVLFTAADAGKPAAKPSTESDELKLYHVNVGTGAVTQARDTAKYALFSPDGKRVLIGRAGDDEDMLTLEVADAGKLNAGKVVASDAAGQIGSGMGPSTDIYPGWIDNKTIHYLATRAVYGTEGKNLALMTVDVTTGKAAAHQSKVDAGVPGVAK